MQNRYAGDIGDYVKLALLRCLSAGRKLGVAWYLHPDEGHNADGKHVEYLKDPSHWRHLDPALFDALHSTVVRKRSVSTLQDAGLVEGVFSSEPLISAGLPWRSRDHWRTGWFERVCTDIGAAEIVFADPDNGLVDDHPNRRRRKIFGKQIPLSEVKALAEGRTAIIYHHNTRRKGGHDAEVGDWLAQVGGNAIAIRATAFSCRTFFVLNPDSEVLCRATSFCEKWVAHKVRLHG